MTVRLRSATPADIDAIADIWHAGWRDGHLGFVPDALLEHRTLATFVGRVRERIGEFVAADIDGQIGGFVVLVDDEVEQIYVSGRHRGAGVAAMLMDHAMQTITDRGYGSAWLAVVGGNARARAFYAKQGWDDEGPFTYQAASASGPVDVIAHRYTRSAASTSAD